MSRVRWFRRASLLACVLALAGSTVACAAGGDDEELPDAFGGTPPADTGTGADVPSGADAPHFGGDAAVDSPTTQSDGGAHDGATTGDGASDGGATDSSAMDTSATDTAAKDTATSDGSTCVAVTLNSGTNDGGVCPDPVSGTCGMADIAGYTPTWIPPTGYHQGLCTSAQIDAFYNDCFASGATETTCEAEITAAPDCYDCIFSDETAASYGPIIDLSNGISEINEAGCIALLEPCNLTCAEEVLGSFQCENAACETNCPVTDTATLDAFDTCEDTAAACDPDGCDVFVTEATCASELTGAAHPASVCTSATTFEDYYNAVVPVFCGP
jgi:hypothetical protein